MPYLYECPRCGAQKTTDGTDSGVLYCSGRRSGRVCGERLPRPTSVPPCWSCGGELIKVRSSYTCFDCTGARMMTLSVASDKYRDAMAPTWRAEAAEREKSKAEQAERMADLPIATAVTETNLFLLDGVGYFRKCKAGDSGATECLIVRPQAARRNRAIVGYVREAKRIGGMSIEDLKKKAKIPGESY